MKAQHAQLVEISAQQHKNNAIASQEPIIKLTHRLLVRMNIPFIFHERGI